ncbi:uncharacterized protein LOC117107750 [Anneissia japonica]|uniref:uncharacterized protein LOC117107750 n=1 Tax=Anneissia japonica TaxID=1529436 RepID=UPI001425686F|nr:uncharacterized protein LOC117107750 [Anneissia japonica]
MYLCVTNQRSTMKSCKNNTIDTLAKCLAFVLFAIISNNAATGGTIYSVHTNLNGAQGTNIKITFILNTTESENYTAQLFKDGDIVDKIDNRFTITKEEGKIVLKIQSLQRHDKGNYSIKYGPTISETTFLNIIEIPSTDYPKIQLKKVNENQLEIWCISEKTSPRPNLSINGEDLGFNENEIYMWTIKTVNIRANMTQKLYLFTGSCGFS